jgi:isochorismate hydrolase
LGNRKDPPQEKKKKERKLVPDFWGNSLHFSPLNMMLAIGLSYIAFIMLRYVSSIPSFLKAFIMK